MGLFCGSTFFCADKGTRLPSEAGIPLKIKYIFIPATP